MVKMIILWSNSVVKLQNYHFDHGKFGFFAIVMVKIAIV